VVDLGASRLVGVAVVLSARTPFGRAVLATFAQVVRASVALGRQGAGVGFGS
jgi:hypothetical protein